jgi:hypothetical protein
MRTEPFRIFISSTYEDLVEERVAVRDTVHRMGDICDTMELFADDRFRTNRQTHSRIMQDPDLALLFQLKPELYRRVKQFRTKLPGSRCSC